MASPGINGASCFSAIWQPIAGIALAALGAWSVGVGLVEPSAPNRQIEVVLTPRVVDANLSFIAGQGREPVGVLLSWERGPGGAGHDVLMFREPALRPRCLKADLVAEPAPPPKECGAARKFLMQSATARWLAPRFRAAEEWSETSGYGVLETSRAQQHGDMRTSEPALECAIGAEHQQAPACSVLAERELPAGEAVAATRIDTRARQLF